MINYNLTTVPDTLKVLQAVEETTDVGASVAFTCYYSIFSIVDPSKDPKRVFHSLSSPLKYSSLDKKYLRR